MNPEDVNFEGDEYPVVAPEDDDASEAASDGTPDDEKAQVTWVKPEVTECVIYKKRWVPLGQVIFDRLATMGQPHRLSKEVCGVARRPCG